MNNTQATEQLFEEKSLLVNLEELPYSIENVTKQPLSFFKKKENYVRWMKDVYVPLINKAKKKYGISVPYGFVPRWYQVTTIQAMMEYRFVIFCNHRRSGKDYMSVSMLLLKMMERVGNYYYLFPTAKQGRKIIWEGIDNDGKRFRDHIPKALVKINHRSKEPMINNVEMMITLVNGSTIQIVGSDNYDSTIVGTNVAGVIFSEYALSDPLSWGYLRPILGANEGWAWLNSTPRGKNHFYKMLKNAIENEKLRELWWGTVIKNSETDVVSEDEIEIMKAEGMSEQMIAQELECAFEGILDGVIYSLQLIEAKRDKRFGLYYPDIKEDVFIGFDIGIDTISMVFFQNRGNRCVVIDYYGCKGMGIGHVKMIADEFSDRYMYKYGRLFLPHDASKRDVNNYDANGYALTTYDTFKKEFKNIPIEQIERCASINDDIEIVRSRFHHFDFFVGDSHHGARKERLEYFYDALSSYSYPPNSRDGREAVKPKHNWASHPCDAFRTCIHAHAKGYTSENARTWLQDIDKMKSQIRCEDTVMVEANLI